MNQRVSTIIQMFSDTGKSFSIVELAEKFEVSQRTIRNDLKTIDSLLKENLLPVLKVQKDGKILVPEDFAHMSPIIQPSDLYQYKLSKNERVWAASAMLISAEGFLTLAMLAESLFVSRATIINDLDDIRAFIEKGSLRLISRANKGLMVDGPESVKRLTLMKMLDADLNHQGKEIQSLVKVQGGDPIIFQKIINEQEHTHQSFLTDASFKNILLFLGIMTDRNSKGRFLEHLPFESNDKYLMAQDILRLVSQYMGITVTGDDINMLSRLLDKARYLSHPTFENNVVRVQMITRKFIDCISEDMGMDLDTDYDFFEALSNHLVSTLSAPLLASPDWDILNEVLEDNKTVFDVVKNNLSVINSYLDRDISEVEIAYIVIHVCAAIERKKNSEFIFHVIVACHAGIGTSHLLMERLKKHFNFRIVDIVSAHEASNIPEGMADFIISTVPLQNCKLDYVIVSPAFNDNDYVRIGNKIDALRNSRNLPNRIQEQKINARGMIERIRPIVYGAVPEKAAGLMRELRRTIRDYFNQSSGADTGIFSPYLHHLLPQNNIELDVECRDWKEAVKKSAEKLLERGIIEARYIDAMISNMEENGPYVVISKGFAIPHAGLEEGSISLGMYLIRLKEPVSFGADELDPVSFVCCMSAVDHKTHLKAFFNLVNLLQDDEFKEKLTSCKTSEGAALLIERSEYMLPDFS